jgi:hypothetical protein
MGMVLDHTDGYGIGSHRWEWYWITPMGMVLDHTHVGFDSFNTKVGRPIALNEHISLSKIEHRAFKGIASAGLSTTIIP